MTTTQRKMDVSAKATYTVRVPAGTYFLGDPCYAVPDRLWIPLLESCYYFGDRADGPSDHFLLQDLDFAKAGPVGEVEGHQVLAFGTGGDGLLTDQYGNEYGVDAGLFGLVPKALTDLGVNSFNARPLEKLGQWVTFDVDTTVTFDGTVMRFGRFQIDLDED